MNARIFRLIKKYNLELAGLTVITEAASDAYLLNPFIAVGAGAQKVICQTKTTRFGLANDIINQTRELAAAWGCLDRIVIKETLNQQDFIEADIITNSAHLRPITKECIGYLKSTAVIPLMWETWEFRSQDLDLMACKEKDILVLGTDESAPPCDMRKYSGMIGVKLALELGLEIAGNKILLLGSTGTLCISIKDSLQYLGAEIIWCSHDNTESDFHYEELRQYLQQNAMNFDAILIAEHHFPEVILGVKGECSFATLAQINPDIRIGISCGNVDVDDLKESKLMYFPKDIQPFGYMSYQSYHLGSLPVMDLFASGLKVGEIMARARLSGMSPKAAALYAINNSPAMDFEGEYSWL